MKMNKYNLKYTNRFSKDLKLTKKRGYNLKLLEKVVEILINREKLSVKNKDYALKNKYLGYRECCITSDWLLVYKIKGEELILLTMKTKTPSSLF